MNPDDPGKDFLAHVDEMRRRFDQIFASPESTPPGECDDFLAVRIGGHPFALRVSELARIEFMGRLTVLPGSNPWLLGLAGIKGKLLPVYSLELVLGHDRSSGEKNWLAIGREESLGLAFDAMDGYCRIQRADVVSTSPTEPNGMLKQLALKHNGELLPVVHLQSIVAAIRARISSPTSADRV